MQTLPEELRAQGVIFGSLESACREHPDLVLRYLGRAVENTDNKFAALNAAYWSGGVFLYVPKNVRVEEPFRVFRWISQGGSTAFGRTLFVGEEGAHASLVDTVMSPDFVRQTLSVGTAEIYADESAHLNYVGAQRLGTHAVHLHTDRLIAGRDSRITTLYVALGGAVTRGDIQCRMRAPGSHVDMLGLYIANGEQHFDHQTLQDHISPHASSNLLFKGALTDQGRSVFRGLIRVHPKAQRTDAYQTNRNLILSNQARADSLPNLEIEADDVRCSHAATVGQLDEEEVFYLLSRGIPKIEAIRLVVFGFFSEVLDQLPEELAGVSKELMGVVERKLAESRG
jgi:Fe-S cluster assembly protein SufD